MPVQVIIRKPKMPESCESCDDRLETWYGQGCGLTQGQGGYCPLREVPEWTEKDHNNLVLIKHCMTNDESIMDTLERLCQLAGVVEE